MRCVRPNRPQQPGVHQRVGGGRPSQVHHDEPGSGLEQAVEVMPKLPHGLGAHLTANAEPGLMVFVMNHADHVSGTGHKPKTSH
jgi:hypothetical protein